MLLIGFSVGFFSLWWLHPCKQPAWEAFEQQSQRDCLACWLPWYVIISRTRRTPTATNLIEAKGGQNHRDNDTTPQKKWQNQTETTMNDNKYRKFKPLKVQYVRTGHSSVHHQSKRSLPLAVAAVNLKVAGLIPLVCMSECPWPRCSTPNCSWFAGQCVQLQCSEFVFPFILYSY